jgi:hypothetical protein
MIAYIKAKLFIAPLFLADCERGVKVKVLLLRKPKV